jgi:hypothetical protein
MRFIVVQYDWLGDTSDVFWGPFDTVQEAADFGETFPESSGFYIQAVYEPPSS